MYIQQNPEEENQDKKHEIHTMETTLAFYKQIF